MKTIIVNVELTNNNYAASIDLLPGCISTAGTFEGLRENMQEAVALHLEVSREFGDKVDPAFEGEWELTYKFEPASLLKHYRGIFTNSALERLTGINQRQLQRYASGTSKPRPAQAKRIEQAFRKLGQELQVVELL